jgi:hypothetical protein
VLQIISDYVSETIKALKKFILQALTNIKKHHTVFLGDQLHQYGVKIHCFNRDGEFLLCTDEANDLRILHLI